MNSPFTHSQWQELEQQALIFKYLMAGLPIPPDLVLPIQKSISSLSPRFFHHPNVAYCSVYGKVVDPEPGRCRRTDGKKWRCAKEAYPDSKYCERHMHRGRNRSRKPVESSQSQSQTNSSMSSVYNSVPYAVTNRSCYQEAKEEGLEDRLSNKGVQIEEVSNDYQGFVSFGKAADEGLLQSEVGSFALYALKEEEQSVRPFFDEWPKGKDVWCGLEEECSNSTQLSISIPNSRSQHEI